MKIFSFHNFYKIPGGEDKSHKEEILLLRRYGHIVKEFNFFNNSINSKDHIPTAIKSIWSKSVFDHYNKMFQIEKPDFLICQNFFPLISPSIFFAAKRHSIPTMLFLRNYRLFCLNGLAYLGGSPCEKCKTLFIPIPGVVHRCYRNSLLGSISVALLITINKFIKTWQTKVDAFIVLSNFSKKLFIESGIPPRKIFVRPNFLAIDPNPGEHGGDYFLFIGRLSDEKGILELVDLWIKYKIEFKLKIIGVGQLESKIVDKIRENKFIELIGFLESSEVIKNLQNSFGLIVNSKWYEGMPRVLIEAFATSTPVIAPKLGVFPEMIDHNINGLLFSSGNTQELFESIKFAIDFRNQWLNFGKAGRLLFDNHYSEAIAYTTLIEIYNEIK